jgi:protease-4
MSFLKSFLASLLALVVFSVLSFVMFFIFLAAISADEKVYVAQNSVLRLNLDAQITEQEIVNPFEGIPMLDDGIQRLGLLELKSMIRHAADDSKIKGIYLNVSYPIAGFSTLEEIRLSLEEFRKSGKWVVAYADVMTEQAYYLASVADKVYLNPEGEVEFNGLAIEVTFFKRLFDKLEIKPEIFRVGEFKSAVEPFMLDKMSDANRLQLNEMVNSIYDHVLTRIGASREIPVDKLKEISDKMLARNAALAVEHGLIDSLLYYDQVLDVLNQNLGKKDSSDLKFISYGKYKRAMNQIETSAQEIAVIVADGTIMPGRADQGVIGSDTFTETIRKARLNKRVKAIVLRINSPGGSFQASDLMWREITLAAQTKPVIASMGDYAASGGYYLAMGCDTIVAQPHTITGSIGIFSVLFDASGLLNNKIGITTEEVKTGEYGELITISRPLSDIEKNYWQRRTEEIYETFTSKAAAGRNMTIENLKNVASGRVWTGVQGKERGLVDVLGGYEDAIAIAAQKAGIEDDYRIKIYPQQKSFLEEFFSRMEENARIESLQQTLGTQYPLYQQWRNLSTYHGVQARMPFEFTIH